MNSSYNDLPRPPISTTSGALEVLRVWTAPGATQEVVVNPAWSDPGTWGILLVDAARHAAKAYAALGLSEDQAFARILELFRAEIKNPTANPEQISVMRRKYNGGRRARKGRR